jgi:hypothetical protein
MFFVSTSSFTHYCDHQETLFSNTVWFSLFDGVTVCVREDCWCCFHMRRPHFLQTTFSDLLFSRFWSRDFKTQIRGRASLVSIGGCILVFHSCMGQPSSSSYIYIYIYNDFWWCCICQGLSNMSNKIAQICNKIWFQHMLIGNVG